MTGRGLTAGVEEAVVYRTLAALDGLDCLWARFSRHRYRPHVHESYVIALVTRGVETIGCAGERHAARAGDLFLVNPDTLHDGEAGAAQGWEYHVFYPTVEQMRAVLPDPERSAAMPVFRTPLVRDPELARRLVGLHARCCVGEPDLADQLGWAELLTVLLDRHAEPGPEPGTAVADRPLVRRAKELLEASVEEGPPLATVAAALGVSRHHLIRSFRRSTGAGPRAYLIARRLERAKRLLKAGAPPSEAAYASGFADQSHLNRLFKAAYGTTPGAIAKAAGSGRRVHFVQ